MFKELRPYQQIAVDSAYKWLHQGTSRAGIIVLPVGSGKTVIIAELIKKISFQYPRTKIIVVSHVQELLQQGMQTLISQWPEADACFYSSGIGQKRLHSDIVFCGIQSVYKKIAEFIRCPTIIIQDECHLTSHKEDTTYRKFFNDILMVNPNARFIGATASPFRSDTGRIDEGEGRFYEDIIYEIDLRWMMENGYLCKPITPKGLTHIDTTGVAVRGGDYVESQLESVVDNDNLIKSCVNEILLYGSDRKKWLIFTPGVKTCEHVRDEVRIRGISCEMILGDTPKEERRNILSRYRDGNTRCLVNVAVLTTGVDVPAIDLIAGMRPMRSPVLYQQTVGRGLRLYPDKRDLLYLDFGGVIEELGPLDAIDIRKRFQNKDGDPAQPVTKICPSCATVCMGGQKWCYNCMYEFLMGTALDRKSDKDREIMSFGEPERKSVLGMTVAVHTSKAKPDGPKTLRVDYDCLDKKYSEWLCFSHTGYARDKAIAWHNKMRPDIPAPIDTESASHINYPKPTEIEVRQEGKYWRVINTIIPENAIENLWKPDWVQNFEEVSF